jgi:ABC-2 type transport system permease protein
MSLRRVAILLRKEVVHGSKGFLFIFALVMPVILSLVLSLLFGTLFSGKPTLGIADLGTSQLVPKAKALDSLIFREYASAPELRNAVGAGAVDMGLVLPSDFDRLMQQGDLATLDVYVWGESLLKNRLLLGSTIAVLIREVEGQEVPVEIVATTVGEGESIPWEQRILPVIVLMAVLMGGSLVPATSLVEEKQKRTLTAVTLTPTTVGEVLLSKGLLGFGLSLLVALVVLFLNRAFGAQPVLLVGVLALGAIMAAAFGVLLGVLVKDINTLFATVKGIGVFLYAPALVYLFPQIPAWIGRLLPTYYIVAPVVEISQEGGSWPDVAMEMFVLVGLIVLLVGAVGVVARKMGREGT